MASPFAVFRRNQKLLLAIVGIGAMVAFVFLDPLMKYVGRNQAPENPVVVETRYGNYTESQMANMRDSRELVDRFLLNLCAETVAAEIKSGMRYARDQETQIQQLHNAWHQFLMGRLHPGREESAVETLVLSKRAEQAGMVINDRAINDLIKQITDDTLPSAVIQGVINGLNPGRRVSAARLFDAIRTEMLASRYSQLFLQSLRDVPPAQRFEYYESLNRKARCQVMPLAVADFVKEVSAEPTDKELQEFYDEYKNRYPNPASPDPGFKEPKRASFQYFKADFAQFKEQFKPQVTDAEIREYYEQNKAQFRVVELPKDEDKESGDAAPADADKKDADAPEGAAKEPEAKESAAPEEPPQPAKKPADEKPAAEKPADDKQSTVTLPKAALRLASFATGADDEAAATQDDSASATPTDEKPAEAAADKPADEKPAADGDKPEGEAAQEGDAKPGESADAKPAEEIKYEPLEKVADTIRESIAGQKAIKEISDIFDDLSAIMRRYADNLDVYNSNKETNSKAAPPAPLAFAELAKEKKLEARELTLVTAAQAAAEDIGKVMRRVRDPRTQFGIRVETFPEFAFSDTLVTYRPGTAFDNEGNGYLFWKTEEKAAFVPPLDKIRDQVVLAWKTVKARELARKRGMELAEQARSAKQSLEQFFGSQPSMKVSETNAFSWLSTGNVPMDPSSSSPRLSAVEGVENPGEEFMKTVFRLSPGEIGVAANHPQDTIYVVQLTDFEPPAEELRKDFAAEHPMRYMAVADQDRRKIYVAWLDGLNKDARIHWVRPADSAVGRRGGSEPPPDDYDY